MTAACREFWGIGIRGIVLLLFYFLCTVVAFILFIPTLGWSWELCKKVYRYGFGIDKSLEKWNNS
jgi:hypothetical protein